MAPGPGEVTTNGPWRLTASRTTYRNDLSIC